MKIAVVGGGGVGGYMAAKLSLHFPTTLISRSLYELCLIENDHISFYHPTISPKPRETYDLIIFATKSFVLEDRAKEMLPYTHKKSLILPLLNGIEPYYTLKKYFANVLKGAIYILAHKTAQDCIQIDGKGALVAVERNETIAKVFDTCQIPYKMPENIDKAIWQKYLFIAATAALTTLHSATFGEIVKDHLQEFISLLEEIAKVAQKYGVKLSQEDLQKAIKILQKSPFTAKSSMQRDFEKGNCGELDNLIGFLAKDSQKINSLYQKLLSQCRK